MARGEITRIGAIGAGSWGTALANLLAEQGYTVDLWVREEDVYEEIKHVLQHEIAHHFGITDQRLKDLDVY